MASLQAAMRGSISGTGACATLVAAAANGLTEKSAVLKLNGGDLLIEWKDGIVYQEGPAEFVFDGEIQA